MRLSDRFRMSVSCGFYVVTYDGELIVKARSFKRAVQLAEGWAEANGKA